MEERYGFRLYCEGLRSSPGGISAGFLCSRGALGSGGGGAAAAGFGNGDGHAGSWVCAARVPRDWTRPFGFDAGSGFRELDVEDGVGVEYIQASAENTGLPDSSFDVITAGQCWHWFQRSVAAKEALRLLRPNGAFVIAHFDWLPLPGSIGEANQRALIVAHNPAWKMGAGAAFTGAGSRICRRAGSLRWNRSASMWINLIVMERGAGGFGRARGWRPRWIRLR